MDHDLRAGAVRSAARHRAAAALRLRAREALGRADRPHARNGRGGVARGAAHREIPRHLHRGAVGEGREHPRARPRRAPGLGRDRRAAHAPAARYPVLFWEGDARFAGALTYLRRKHYNKIWLVSHSMGSRMANHYISAHPQVPFAGWISLSISSGDMGPFKRIKFPVYDVYAENDLEAVIKGAPKRAATLKGLRGSSQTMMFGTDHYFAKKERDLVSLIRLLLEGEKK